MKRSICRLIGLILLISTFLSVAAACSDELGEFTVNEKIVCEVDGTPVTYDDYKYFFYTHLTAMKQIEPKTDFSSGEGFKRIKEMTEDSLRRRQVILNLCDKYELELTDEDEDAVNTYVQSQMDELGGELAYREYLLENRLTGKVFRDQTKLTFCYDLYLRDYLKRTPSKAIDLSADAIIADVTGGNFYRYTQIFLRLDVGELSVPLEAQAREAYALLCSGASFTSVAATYSEWNRDHSEGVYATVGEKEEILEETVLALEVGEISEVIASSEGYHIFKRLPIDVDYVTKNFEDFEEQYFNRRYLEFIAEKSKKIKIEYAKYFSNISYADLTKKETLD